MTGWVEKLVFVVLAGVVLWVGYDTFLGPKDVVRVEQGVEQAATCPQSENPYPLDSAYYAGFEWGKRNGCLTGSAQYREGCNEYKHQKAELDLCLGLDN